MVDIEKILEAKGLNRAELEKLLFPNIRYANIALNRIIKGESELTASQIQRMAQFLGISIEDLFEVKPEFKGKMDANCLRLDYKGYTFRLYTGMVDMSKGAEHIKDLIIPLSSKPLTLEEFLVFLKENIDYFEKEQ